jgi:hypothetical protein
MKLTPRFPLTLTLSLGERGKLREVADFFCTHFANPATSIFTETANDSPSPWGEGRGEGEPKH